MALEMRSLLPGSMLAPSIYTMAPERIRAFVQATLGNRREELATNPHADEQAAKALGRPGVTASGLLVSGCIEDYLLATFGSTWLAGSKLSVKFISSVLGGDTLTVSARVTACDKRDQGTRITLEIGCVNQRGKPVVVGTAEITLP